MMRTVVLIVGAVLVATPAHAQDRTTCTIERVIDGDTFVCEGESVRLLLIDAPERGQDGARKATQALRRLLPIGATAELERDVTERDRYGRLLAYVHVHGRHLNEEMVSRGFAIVSVYPPDRKHEVRLRALQEQAKEAGRGLWAEDAFDCTPAAHRRKSC